MIDRLGWGFNPQIRRTIAGVFSPYQSITRRSLFLPTDSRWFQRVVAGQLFAKLAVVKSCYFPFNYENLVPVISGACVVA